MIVYHLVVWVLLLILFNASKTYTCTLRVWLQDSGSSQNNLMNKSFSGLVKVGTAIKEIIYLIKEM